MRASCLLGLCCLTIVLMAPSAWSQAQKRTLRVGNSNLLLFGGGFSSFDHPNYDAKGFANLAYQHRILRRELRLIHLWLRGAANFSSEDRTTFNDYTVWVEPLAFPNVEARLDEHTSDFTVRAEMIGDVLRSARSAIYVGGGFAVHYISFNTRGCGARVGCSSNSFSTNDNLVSPSVVVGGRLFALKKTYAVYSELRYGRAYGKKDVPRPPPLNRETFGFTAANTVSLEGGLGLHW